MQSFKNIPSSPGSPHKSKRRRGSQPKFIQPAVKVQREKRYSADDLNAELAVWDKGLTDCQEMRLIACGSTAMTLLGYKKELAKDVEFLIPIKKEYGQLSLFLKRENFSQVTTTGWKRPNLPLVFNLYSGNRVYAAELLSSPLENSGNKKILQWKKIYLGVLNSIDLIISRLFRGSEQDFQDSLILLRRENINALQLKKRYRETALYDLREARLMRNFDRLMAGDSAFNSGASRCERRE